MANAQQEALLLLRILAYDRNLTKRTSDEVVIVVVHKSGNATSESAGRDIVGSLLAAAKKVSVAGRKVKVRSEAFGDTTKNLSNTAAFYVATGLDDHIAAISQISRTNKILTFSNVEGYVSSLAIGIVPKDKSMSIIVNLKSAKAEGADLDSALLKLADVRK